MISIFVETLTKYSVLIIDDDYDSDDRRSNIKSVLEFKDRVSALRYIWDGDLNLNYDEIIIT